MTTSPSFTLLFHSTKESPNDPTAATTYKLRCYRLERYENVNTKPTEFLPISVHGSFVNTTPSFVSFFTVKSFEFRAEIERRATPIIRVETRSNATRKLHSYVYISVTENGLIAGFVRFRTISK